jgi:hypothetical protein
MPDYGFFVVDVLLLGCCHRVQSDDVGLFCLMSQTSAVALRFLAGLAHDASPIKTR